MKYLFLGLVIFFLHVKFDLLTLVSGYGESVVNLNFLYFIIFSQRSFIQCFITSYLYKKE